VKRDGPASAFDGFVLSGVHERQIEDSVDPRSHSPPEKSSCRDSTSANLAMVDHLASIIPRPFCVLAEPGIGLLKFWTFFATSSTLGGIIPRLR